MSHSAEANELDRAFLKGMRVLYVEDDEDVRHLLAIFLRRRVASVVVAADGLAGLEAFAAERPDLVVTDIQMPRMDGLTMAEELRRAAPGLPILITTAFEQPSYLLRSIEIGVDKYVTKPVDSDRMHAALLAVARQLRAEAALAEQHRLALVEARRRHLEAIGLLAGGMAHDFNNLLQIVVLNLELAADLVSPTSLPAELIESARASSERASALSQRLLDLSRGGLLSREPLHAERLIGRALGDALAGTAVKVALLLDPALPELCLDARLFGRVFEHLARNAADAMPSGGTLTVRGRRRPSVLEDGLADVVDECVELTFDDSGPGIAPSLLARVFEPYVSGKPRGSEKGMGLGLALCRAIVHKHEGSIHAGAAEGGGARITIVLPLGPGVDEPAAS